MESKRNFAEERRLAKLDKRPMSHVRNDGGALAELRVQKGGATVEVTMRADDPALGPSKRILFTYSNEFGLLKRVESFSAPDKVGGWSFWKDQRTENFDDPKSAKAGEVNLRRMVDVKVGEAALSPDSKGDF